MGIQTVSQALSNENGGSSPFGFKNRIINGAMVIDQRNAGASVSATNAELYTIDRFKCLQGIASSKFTVQQSSIAPTGFTKSIVCTSSSSYSLLSTDYFLLRQTIEGFNVADLGWGTASAATVTLSFWVRSSLTGAFGGSIGNGASNRQYPFSYTINAANTWEQKTITIPGDTTGSWETTINAGIVVGWSIGMGSAYLGTANAWAGTFYGAPTGSINLVSSNASNLYITGVQLEKGPQATAFDYRDYGREFIMCQRYFEKSYNIGTVAGTSTNTAKGSLAVGAAFSQFLRWTQNYRVSKRADATLTIYSTTGASGNVRYNNGADLAVTIEDSGENASAIYVNRSWSLGDFVWWQWTASAEL